MPSPDSPRNSPRNLGVAGLVSAVAGFFLFGIVLGPVAVICGWLAMRRGGGRRSILAVIAVVLGALDFLVAALYLTNGNWTN